VVLSPCKLQEQSLHAGDLVHDRYGFAVSPVLLRGDSVYAKWERDYVSQEQLRNGRWAAVVKAGLPGGQLRSLARGGVPPSLRPRVWRRLCESEAALEKQGHYFVMLLRCDEQDGGPAAAQIERDLLRTFPDHPLYTREAGITPLRRVLTAFALHNREVGYCQSMNFITALLLLFLSEEDTFWVLSHLVERSLPNFYSRGLMGVKACAYVALHYMQEKLPRLAAHVYELEFPLHDCLSKWFMHLFVRFLPSESLLRVIDVLMADGMKALVRVVLAILKLQEEELLACRAFEDLWAYLDNMPAKMYDADALLDTAYNKKVLGKLSSFQDVHAKCTKKLMQYSLDVLFAETLKVSDLSRAELTKIFKYLHSVCGRSVTLDHSQLSKVAQRIWNNQGVARAVVDILFAAATAGEGAGVVELKDVLVGVSVLMKGTEAKKLRYCFKCFDSNCDGLLTVAETNRLLALIFGLIHDSTLSEAHLAAALEAVKKSAASEKLISYDKLLEVLTADELTKLWQLFTEFNNAL